MIDAGTQEQAKEAPAPADTENPDSIEEDEKMLETPMEVLTMTFFTLICCLAEASNLLIKEQSVDFSYFIYRYNLKPCSFQFVGFLQEWLLGLFIYIKHSG